MTNPALAELTRLLPPPDLELPALDWEEARGRMGVGVPGDYKALVGAYGCGEVDGYFDLLTPPPTRTGSEIAEYNDGHMADLEGLWGIGGNRPAEFARPGARLVVWGSTVDADSLGWLALPGAEPDDWPVAVLDVDSTGCELYPMPVSAFLAGLLSGNLDSPTLSDQLARAAAEQPGGTHRFSSFHRFLRAG